MSKTSRASLSMQVTKGRLGKMLAHCSTRWVTRLHRTWKRLRYSMLSLLQSLLARSVFRNPRHHASGEDWSKEDVLLVEEDPVRGFLSKQDIYKIMHPDRMHRSAEGAGWCHCKAPLDNLCLVMVTGRSLQRLEERKCHFYFQERQEGRLREPQTGQPHLGGWWNN